MMAWDPLDHHNRIAVRTLALASRLKTVMRRVSFLAVFLAAAVLALGSVQLGTSAQTGTPPAAGQGFVGAWRLTSETPAGASQGLLTLMADGTVVFSGRPVAPTGGDPPVAFIGTGHGAWEQTGPTTAAASFVVFITDGEGNFLWVVTDSVEMTLDPDGTSWSGLYSSTTADPSGNVLFIAPGTAEATRIVVQPLATPVATPAP
jgi:hypothetical protein